MESWTVPAQQLYFALIPQPENVFLFQEQEGDGEKVGNASDSVLPERCIDMSSVPGNRRKEKLICTLLRTRPLCP